MPVTYHKDKLEQLQVKVVEAYLLNEQQVLRHNSERLAETIMTKSTREAVFGIRFSGGIIIRL